MAHVHALLCCTFFFPFFCESGSEVSCGRFWMMSKMRSLVHQLVVFEQGHQGAALFEQLVGMK